MFFPERFSVQRLHPQSSFLSELNSLWSLSEIRFSYSPMLTFLLAKVDEMPTTFFELPQELLYMLDLKTYKANFKTSNKYLKYFCNNAASEWTLKKYQKYFSDKGPEEAKKAFMKNLKIVKNNAKGP
ncbi:hypothetical protein K501DRAFT_266928 [Backusella circina FSU 941]|nr:hypothetical protein K501DRAFT_266928 [Backusella circina FSU 941]